jgi:hypothetical protein
MFITLSNIQNDGPTDLNPILDNREGDMEVALTEILYYPAWMNIGEALGNNMFHYGRDKRRIKIPDGYWDVCALNKEVFIPLGLTLSLNPATGLVSISEHKRVYRPGQRRPQSWLCKLDSRGR